VPPSQVPLSEAASHRSPPWPCRAKASSRRDSSQRISSSMARFDISSARAFSSRGTCRRS
jgi:hypothetical protein